MGSRVGLALLPAALFSSSAMWAAEPMPAIGPAPEWVVPAAVPSPDPARKEAPLQLLVTSSQQRVLTDGLENYVEVVSTPQTAAGVQGLGNIMLPWNAERTDLTIHKVTIRRGDSTHEVLKPTEIMVLRRENNLERAVLDGVRTVVIPARGLEVGDMLTVAATYRTRKSAVGNTPEDAQPLSASFPMNRIEYRVLVPDNVPVKWKIGSSELKPQVTRRDGLAEHLLVLTKVEPVKLPENAPDRFKSPLLQFSARDNWGEVAEELRLPFERARRLAGRSAVAEEAEKVAAASPDPGKRLLAALRLVQDRVRYVALLLGDGAYIPATAEETWERRFGDCKGKTALLLALLDKLQIEAEPILVSNDHDDALGDLLPALGTFDHVIVRAKLGGRDYYLDGTAYGHRTLDELAISPFQYGLPIRSAAKLERFPAPPATIPNRELQLVWDASKGTDGPIPFEATLTLRGATATAFRSEFAATTDSEKFETSLKDMVYGVGNEDLSIKEKITDAPDGNFVVRFAGKSEMDWSPFEGERNSRFAFSHGTLHWDADFDRAEGPGKDLPVSLGNGRYWERMTETIILPNGGKGYSVDGKPLEKKFAGSSMARMLYMEPGRVTMVSDFRHHQREITAADARAAEPLLDELNNDWAYVVGPKARKRRGAEAEASADR